MGITITAEKGRLSEEEIERMVEEAEQFGEEDKKVKDRIDGRNGLEGYCYNLKDTLEWLDDNQEAEKEEFEAKQKELEQIANPIIQKVYQQVLVVPVVNQKMTKIWMMKIAMNC